MMTSTTMVTKIPPSEYGVKPNPVFTNDNGRLAFRFDGELLYIEAWGENALRVRATCLNTLPEREWALTEKMVTNAEPTIDIKADAASITNGKIKANISHRGKIVVSNIQTGQILLEEFARHRLDLLDPKCSSLRIQAREWKGRLGSGDFHLTMRFESQDPDERIYGMGQYQQPFMNLKGADLELAQRNSQATVPFMLSSLGYGLLWNNPGVGRAVFSNLTTVFEAYSTDTLDYWVVAGDTPADIVRGYTQATGRVPMMPEYGLGFWQCKLRYQTQDELMAVAREYKKRNLPIDLIVCDYFHWPNQGDWRFDERYWPDPEGMLAELKEMNIEFMVSIWPQVEKTSENYDELLRRGLLIRQDRGVRAAMEGKGYPVHYDATNPEARQFVWETAKRNYFDKGIKVFWLDEAEPEYSVYDFDIFRYHAGPNLSVGNVYPSDYAKGFYEGQKAAGQENIVNLIRCAWAGSQKYGALVWSGDIASSWGSLRNQLSAGLNMGIAGFAWFTTDIGGFHGGVPDDPAFRELFVRWFQWGAYCPVMRLHGDREPKQEPLPGNYVRSGGANEVWSYGEEVYKICEKYLRIREEMRDYTRELMKEAHEKGDPIMRPCFYEFPADDRCWRLEDQYMYGAKYLVAPVLKAGQTKREVYLPGAGGGEGVKWTGADGTVYEGGKSVVVDCPLETMPVFARS